jgi:hypothetical protein
MDQPLVTSVYFKQAVTKVKDLFEVQYLLNALI